MNEWIQIENAPVYTPLIVAWNGVVQNILYTVDSDGVWWTAEEELCVSDLNEHDVFNPTHFMELPKFRAVV